MHTVSYIKICILKYTKILTYIIFIHSYVCTCYSSHLESSSFSSNQLTPTHSNLITSHKSSRLSLSFAVYK